MKLRNFRTFSALLMSLLFVCYFTVWAVLNESNHIYILKVNIPKAFNPNYTDAELWEYVESGNSMPISELEKRNLPIPYYHKFLFISLEKDKKLKINMQEFGDLEDTTPLTQKLTEIFRERETECVYEPNSTEILKAVRIRAPRSVNYSDVVKVIDAVKISGANPIVLQIDDLPQ